jgi:hypothetical protein
MLSIRVFPKQDEGQEEGEEKVGSARSVHFSLIKITRYQRQSSRNKDSD